MKVLWKRILLRALLFLFLSISLHSNGWSQFDQGGVGGGIGSDPGDVGTEDDPGDGGGFPDPDLPIDSNILVLVIAVVGYGLKKWWDVKQNLKGKNSLQTTTANYEDFIK
ncbi:MAG TPA: hypothetical protein VGI61_13075 [Parafilimonas sp.]